MNREEAIQHLRNCRIEEFNENRGADSPPDLRESDLHDLDLDGAWFKGMRLDGSNLRGSRMSTGSFENATLVGCDLAGVTITDASFERANLSGANLKGARLTACRLDDTILTDSSCRGASFAECRIARVSFANCDLSACDFDQCIAIADIRFDKSTKLNDAHFASARLSNVDFSNANLASVSLEGASLFNVTFIRTGLELTNFKGTQLSGGVVFCTDLAPALNLDLCQHVVPSELSIAALLSLKDSCPRSFVRGCGIDPIAIGLLSFDPQALENAAYEARLRAGSVRLQRCFVSYSSEDKIFVDELVHRLNAIGADYWYAPEHGGWGEDLNTQINREIALRERLVVVCSEASLFRSDWVRREVEQALEQGIKRNQPVVFPVMIDEALLKLKSDPLCKRMREVLAGDFRGALEGQAFEEAFGRFAKGLIDRGAVRPILQ